MKRKFNKGFTLLELIVAIAIIAVLTAVTMAGFSRGNKTRAVVLGTDTVISALRTAQTSSLSPQPIAMSSCAPDNTPAEFHVKFNSSSRTQELIAVDKCSESFVLQTYELPTNVELQSSGLLIDGVPIGSGGGEIDIKFVPPFGTMSVSVNGGAFQAFSQSTVALQSSDATVARNVVLDGISGRIDTNSIPGTAIPGSPAPTIIFTATPATIGPSETSTLSWNVSNATNISIDNGIGSVSFTGTQDVTPPSTTTYTLTATYSGGMATSQATVTISGGFSAPGAPTGLNATGQTNQIALNWTAPGSDGGSAITNYKVYRGTSSESETLLTTIGNTTSYTDPISFGYQNGVLREDTSGNPDYISKLDQDANFIYVLGNQGGGTGCSAGSNSSTCSFIEKRSKSTGTLVESFGTNGKILFENNPIAPDYPELYITDIANDSNYIYAIGEETHVGSCVFPRSMCWFMEKFDKATGTLVSGFGVNGKLSWPVGEAGSRPNAVSIDGSYIYISGGMSGSGGIPECADFCLRTEKRDINTGASVTTFDSDGVLITNPHVDIASSEIFRDMAIDSNYIYLIGTMQDTGPTCRGMCWRVEKRSITSGALVTAFDTDGVIVIDPTSSNDMLDSVAIDSSYIYLGGWQGAGCTGGCWRVEKRSITSGALVTAFDTDGIITSNPTSASDQSIAIAIDSNYLYISGYQNSPDKAWRVEKRSITTGALVSGFATGGAFVNNITANPDLIYALIVDGANVYAGGIENLGVSSGTWRIERLDINSGLSSGNSGSAGPYYYKVSAVNSVGESPQSNEASASAQ